MYNNQKLLFMDNILKNSLGMSLCVSALLRMFVCSDKNKQKEMSDMHLPVEISYVLPFIEFFIGFAILKYDNPQTYYNICLLSFLFVTSCMLIYNYQHIDFKNILLYQNNGPSIMFHLSGCVILMHLIFQNKSK